MALTSVSSSMSHALPGGAQPDVRTEGAAEQDEGTRRERWTALLVLVLAAYVIFGSLGARSLENKDITRTAEIARETVETGRWLAPTRENEIETEKPPLYIWLVAGLAKVTGNVGAVETRLPAAAGSFLTVLAVFVWVRSRHGVPAATLAAAFLAAGQIFVELARVSRVDSFFAFLLAASVLLSHEAERRRLSARLAFSAASGVALAGAMLTKSPLLAMVLHLASIGGYYLVDLALTRPWRDLREAAPLAVLRRYLGPPASVPPVLACVLFACWFIPFKGSLTPAEWDSVVRQFIFENTDRAVTGSDKPQPFWYYVPALLGRAFPGSVLAFLYVRHKDAGDRALHRFATCWWLFPLLVLSIATGKQPRYILPCLPGIAIAGALNWRALASSESPWVARVERGLAWFVFAVTAVGAAGLPIGMALRVPEVLGDACWLAVVSFATAALAYRVATRPGASPGLTASALAPLLLAIFVGQAAWNVVIQPSSLVEKNRVVVKHLANVLPADLRLENLVLFQLTDKKTGESRLRKTRILLSIYRNEPLPRVAASPAELLAELTARGDRRALVDARAWADLAPIASALAVEHDWHLPVEKGDDHFRLVRRAR